MQKLNVHKFVPQMLDQLNTITAEKQRAIGLFLCLLAAKKVNKNFCIFNETTFSTLQDFKKWILTLFQNQSPEVVNALLRLLDVGALHDTLFCSFANMILQFSFSDDDLQQISDCLIDKFLLEQYNPTIQTPQWLNRLAITLVGADEGVFYDGVAGAGDTALEAYRYAKKAGGSLKIRTQEVNEFFSCIVSVRMFLEGVEDSENVCGNSIASTLFTNGSEGASVSVMFPPLGIANNFLSSELRFLQDVFPSINISKVPAEWCFALHQIASLAEHGKSVICLSNGALFNAAGAQVRAEMIKSGLLECVISLPPNSFPFSSTAVNLLVFHKNPNKHTQVLMMDAEKLMDTKAVVSNKKRFVLSDAAIEALLDIHTNKKEVADISKLVNIESLIDASLLPEKYVKQSLMSETRFGAVKIDINIQNCIFTDEWRRLDEVADLTIGMNNSKFAKSDENGDAKIIKLSDVNKGLLHIDTVEKYYFFHHGNFKKYEVEPNDILISCKGAAVKVCIVEREEKNLYVSANFFRIRANTKVLHPLYLKYYLESPLGQYFVKSKQSGSVITMINSVEIASLPIYYIPLEKQIELVSRLQKEENQIKQKIEQLTILLDENRWDYYSTIGITKFMNRSEEE